MGKEPVQRRPMTQLERARATALLFVCVHPLVQVLAARATLPEPTISEGEAAALERFCRRFGDCEDRDAHVVGDLINETHSLATAALRTGAP